MKTFAEINKIMLENKIEKDGLYAHIVNEVRYSLELTAEKRNLTYQQASLLEYCGITKEQFETICQLTDEYYCKSENPNITISAVSWAIVKMFNKGILDNCDKWTVYKIAEKYTKYDGDEEEE